MAESIEIVTHCYDPVGMDQYGELLKHQIASLCRHSVPGVNVVLSVVCDPVMSERVRKFIVNASACCDPPPKGLTIRCIELAYEGLFRRAIGRNMCALNTGADLVWFTDCDYAFGLNCLRVITQNYGKMAGLLMPRNLQISNDHQTGDATIARGRSEALPELIDEDYSQRRQRICIGGVQIIGGDLARERGYLNGTKWIEPVDASYGFRSCRCDKAFRKWLGMPAQRVPIPNVYRLRHSKDGRDYNLDGDKLEGKEAW